MGTGEQTVIFGAGIAIGIIGGIGADGYRAWRSAVPLGHAAGSAADCLCWCVFAANVCALLFYLNGGEVRSYFFAAMLIGYVCYRYAAGERIVHLWRWLMRMMRRVLRIVSAAAVIAAAPLSAAVRCTAALGRWLRQRIDSKRKSPPEDKN